MLFLTMFLREDISEGSGPGSVPTRGSVGVPLVNVKQIHNTTRPRRYRVSVLTPVSQIDRWLRREPRCEISAIRRVVFEARVFLVSRSIPG